MLIDDVGCAIIWLQSKRRKKYKKKMMMMMTLLTEVGQRLGDGGGTEVR